MLKLRRNNSWMIGGKEGNECLSYKYSGVTIKSNGSFSLHFDTLKERGHKAYFPIFPFSLSSPGGFQQGADPGGATVA